MLKRLAASLVRRLPLARAAIRVAVGRRRRPGVAAIIVHDERVLLFQHVFWTAAEWGLPGGRIEPGEEAAAAIGREVREECGLDIEIVRRVEESSSHGSTYFLCTAPGIDKSGALPRLSFEVLTARWFRPDALPDGVLASHARAVAAALRS